ncbi:MAG TPA: hypothetical protein VGF69_08610 [Thermoanaerobaculia bacterium]|jgi:hypothetical protein
MFKRPALFVLTLVLCSTPAFAQILDCGTKDSVLRRDAEVARWSAARKQQAKAKGFVPAVNATVRDQGTVVLPADDFTAPFRRPIDLEGKTIVFSPKNAQTFTATSGPLQYENDRGTRLGITTKGGFATIDTSFEFPFFGDKVKRFYVSPHNGIYVEEPRVGEFEQYSDLELASLRQGVIAPLLTTVPAQQAFPSVFARQTGDSLLITWLTVTYDVQAKLFANGDIRFTYRTVRDVLSAGTVITSGKEAWRSQRTELGSVTDPAGDVPLATSPAIAPMLDLQSVTVNRIANTDLLELRLKLGGTVDRNVLNNPLLFVFAFDNDNYLLYQVSKSGPDYYQIPGWGTLANSGAARIEGDTVVMQILQDLVPSFGGAMAAFTQYGRTVSDGVEVFATVGAAPTSVRTDFSALTTADFSRPIVEGFTIPVLSVEAVWETLSAAYGLDAADWDGVAIYQNFLTDIIFYAGAYSTVGNAQVDGIGTRAAMGRDKPRTPALLHMNMVNFGVNLTDQSATHVVLHELGHRWLLHVDIMEDGQPKRSLNPLGAHPAQYVHTPAPYVVFSNDDSSVMGGATFADNGNGTFRSPDYSAYSYSYLDLYLMGLIPASDVKPWFYIAGSNPALGGAYYPPQARTFSGTRKDVTVQQVIDAMGPRKPAWPDTQRKFRVLTVLMTDPSRQATPTELAAVARYRRMLEQYFSVATGNRATVDTMFPIPEAGPRRRATR